MGEDVSGSRQARRVQQALATAGVETVQLWWEYVGLGGEATAIDVEAYLRRRVRLPREQRELLVLAAAGLLGPGPRAAAG